MPVVELKWNRIMWLVSRIGIDERTRPWDATNTIQMALMRIDDDWQHETIHLIAFIYSEPKFQKSYDFDMRQ